jgi:aspartate aminotransferase-like enzyme
MITNPELTEEQQQALDSNHGFVLGSSFVLMSKDVFRNTMGVSTDEELLASLQAINEAMADLAAGRSITLEEAKRRLDEKYGI